MGAEFYGLTDAELTRLLALFVGMSWVGYIAYDMAKGVVRLLVDIGFSAADWVVGQIRARY